jgi:glycosyltransferase involved in cell wall biosynthesis
MPMMLYVGRLMPLKGLERLLRVSDRLMTSGQRFRLCVVIPRGEQYRGRDATYAKRCRELLANRACEGIEVLPHREYLESVLSRADLLVMPHVICANDRVPAESWGRVVEEALFQGVPVVSTDAVPAALELVDEGMNGIIVPWQDESALECAIKAFLSERVE